MKRKSLMIYSILVLAILAVNFASAQEVFVKTREFFGNFYDNILEPTLRFAFKDSGLSGDEFLAKVLLFILLLVVVWLVIERIPLFADKKGVITTISVIFAILAIRVIPEKEWINAIILPYGAVGVSIMVLIPLIVLGTFIYKSGMGRTVQSIMWVIAAVVFIALYLFRFDDLGSLAWAYIAGAVACMLALIFNKTINGLVMKMGSDSLRMRMNQHHAREIRRQLAQLETDHNATPPIVSDPEYHRLRAELEKRLVKLYT